MRFVFGIQVPGDTEAECPGDPVTQWSGCPLDTVDTGGTPVGHQWDTGGTPVGHPGSQGLQSQQLQSMQFPCLVSQLAMGWTSVTFSDITHQHHQHDTRKSVCLLSILVMMLSQQSMHPGPMTMKLKKQYVVAVVPLFLLFLLVLAVDDVDDYQH